MASGQRARPDATHSHPYIDVLRSRTDITEGHCGPYGDVVTFVL
jgi:hypothetical protein